MYKRLLALPYLNEVFSNSFIQTCVSVLAGLFLVDPQLVVGLIVLFVLNVLVAFWQSIAEKNKLNIRKIGKDTVTRLVVYIFALVGAVVLSSFGPVLEWFNAFTFGVIGTWEFIVMLSNLSRIYPPFRSIHQKLIEAISSRTEYGPVADSNDSNKADSI